jgi:N-formylglutamate deformylase
MRDSLQPGFSVSGDTDGRWPLILASPHSGREYPPAFMAASRLSPMQLRRAEDPLVDELLDGVTGVPVLRARFARAFLDLNRSADELDPAMFEGPLPVPSRTTERVAAGLGVLPRVAGQGLDIYRRRLTVGEAETRIAALHRPWHDRLAELIARARTRHGYAILVDCHSMPTPQGPFAPQIILGDRHGSSAAPALVALAEAHFRSTGWRVGRNIPYAGGHTTAFHADPANGIHTLQIEIDRSLYLDPLRLTRGRHFDSVARQLTSLVESIVAAAPSLALGPAFRDAAE